MLTQFVKSHNEIWKVSTDYQKMLLNIQGTLEKYIIVNRLGALVLGVSGGIDSALCAALAEPVCNKLKIPLVGMSITIENRKEEERAKAVGNNFCTVFKEPDLTKDYYFLKAKCEEYINSIDETDQHYAIRTGNIKARMRMIYLYNLAQFYNGMVLSTDNYTEYLLGFWTLHGDVGDYGMIQKLWKTEVYGLSQYLADQYSIDGKGPKYNALRNCIIAVPTDGLGITDSDLDQLGVPTYAEVDKILMSMCLRDDFTPIDTLSPIFVRHSNSNFKRSNPLNIAREVILK